MESERSVETSGFDWTPPGPPRLLMEMSDVQVRSGEVAEFRCSFDGLPFTGVVWDHDGRSVAQERARSSQMGGLLSLVIQGVGVADQGVYRCTANNTHGHNSSSAQLTVEAKEANVTAETPIPTDSVRKVSQADRAAPSGPSEHNKQEALEKLGLSPPPSQRPLSLISHLCFPDGAGGRRPSGWPDFLIRLPPELLVTNASGGALSCVAKGAPSPVVIWLYNRLNVDDSVSFSLKHDGPLCWGNGNNVGPGRGGSAGNAGYPPVMKEQMIWMHDLSLMLTVCTI
ncbi:striated muscle-specific serine/threonine-protein kinase [Antennarius striatus]|uniref:striated muscle-specific serine/threonine-protein kinase n=1 Tax=Antennarius striatus TaxID=241820 RepID=UPI0035B262E8